MRIAPNLRPGIVCITMLILCMAPRSFAQNPVAYWPFTGNAQDASGNRHDGTVAGSTLTTDRFGNANSAYRFNAASKTYIQVPHHPQLSFGTAPFSICAWVRICNAEHSDYAGVVVKGPTQIFYPGYQLVVTRTNRVMIQLGDQAMLGVERRGQRNLGDGLWHFLVLTVSPQSRDIRLYVDGVLEGYTETFSSNAPYNVSMVDNTPLFIGKERNSVVYFTGSIDDVRIYNRVISNSEIQNLYRENGWTGNPPKSTGANTKIGLCGGGPSILEASISDSYRWSTGAMTRSIMVNQPGVYWVTGTDDGGCVRTDTFTVAASSAPQLQLPPADSICQGDSVTIGAVATSGTPPFTYQWSPTNGLSSAFIAMPSASPQQTTTYSLTATDALGCAVTADVTVVVKAAPVARTGNARTICLGDSTIIGATATGGTGSFTYAWSPTGGLSATDIATPQAKPTTTTTYYLTVLDANGCADRDSVTITVGSVAVSLDADTNTICAGNSTLLRSNIAGGITPYRYQWTPPQGLNAANIPTPIATPAQSTRYILTVTDGNNCISIDSVMVIVAAAPVAAAGNNTSICNDESIILGTPATGGTPPYRYQWSPSGDLSAPDIATPTASPQKATTYVLTVTDANDCTAIDSVTVNIKPSPVMNLQPQSFCKDFGPVTIGAQATGGSGLYTYSWSPASGLSATDVAQPVANPDSTTTYQVRVTDANGCETVASVTVTINTAPVASAGPDIDVCTGASATIGQHATGGAAPYSYAWTPATGLNTTNIATPTVSPEQPTRYMVIVTDANGCRDTASVMVDIQPGTLKILSASSQTPYSISAMNSGTRVCDSVLLVNTGPDTLVIDAAYLQKNLKFSVPPSQLPLTILPGAEHSLYICYTPTFDERDDDTLYLQSECFYQVALTGYGMSPALQGSDVCGSPISVRQNDSSEALLRVLAPYPNPASISIAIPIEKLYPAGQEGRQERCLLYDELGNLVAEATYAEKFSRQYEVASEERGVFTLDVQSLASGLYFIHVSSDTEKIILPVIVGE
jgi:hypothetical protein